MLHLNSIFPIRGSKTSYGATSPTNSDPERKCEATNNNLFLPSVVQGLSVALFLIFSLSANDALAQGEKVEGLDNAYVFSNNINLEAAGNAESKQALKGETANGYFDVTLSDVGKKMVTDSENMNVGSLNKLLGKEGRVTYKGKEPTSARLIVYFQDPSGKGKTLEGKEFKIKPGTHSLGRFMDEERITAFLEKAVSDNNFFPDSIFFPDSAFFPDGYFFPDSTFFPDGYFEPRKHFPDSAFQKMNLEKNEAGIIMVLLPEEEMREEIDTRPMGLVLSPR